MISGILGNFFSAEPALLAQSYANTAMDNNASIANATISTIENELTEDSVSLRSGSYDKKKKMGVLSTSKSFIKTK